MRIPKSVAAFKKWARKPRLKSGQIQNIGACVAFNEVKRDSISGVCRVLAIVAEECAMRWEKAGRVAVVLTLLALTGCALRYENDNGPRGPERLTLGSSWPKPLSCRGEPVPVEKAP